MAHLLFVDDEISNIEMAVNILQMSLPEITIHIAETVEESIEYLSNQHYDLMIMDIFIPIGKDSVQTLGPRSRKYKESMRHLGGLVILDYVEHMQVKPRILAHTACTDYALIEVLGEVVYDRIPKPAAVEVLLNEIRKALDDK